MGQGRVFDGVGDWLKTDMGFPPFGGNVTDSFTIGAWLDTTDSAAVDRAILSVDDSTTNTGFGLYWNKDEILVKYYYRTPATPSDPGVFQEFSEAYAAPLGTPFFIAVTATMDTPGNAAVPTFRFYAGTTFAGIAQIGTTHVASGSIKTTTRTMAIGAATTTGSYTSTAGTYFDGVLERVGFFWYVAYSVAQLKDFAEFGTPNLIDNFVDFGEPGGQVFEMWGAPLPSGPVEKDIGINFFTAQFQGGMVEGDVTASIIPTPTDTWTIKDDLGTGRWIASLLRLDNDRILAGVWKSAIGSSPAEVWASDDEGASWTLVHTFPTSPMVLSIDMMIDLGSGVVIAAGPILSQNPKIWKSTDYGDTFSEVYQIPTGTVMRSLVDLGSGTLLAGTGTGGKLYRSTDSGDNWSELSTTAGINTFSSIINLGGGNLRAAGTTNNIYSSSDSGANWSSLSTMTGGTAGKAQMRLLDSGRIIATNDSGNIYTSDDDGSTWTRTLDLNDYISLYQEQQTVLGPISGQYIVSATENGYLFVTADEGDTWTLKYNTRGTTTQEAAIKLNDNTLLVSGNYWLCSSTLLLYTLEFTPQVRVVNQVRTLVYSRESPCGPQVGDCCHPVVMQAPQQHRTETYIQELIRNLAQHRTSSWIQATGVVTSEVRITQARKEYIWRVGPAVQDPAVPPPPEVAAKCAFIPTVRILRASDFKPVMELDLYATLRYTRRWTDLDDFELKFSCDTDQGLRLAQILKPSDGSKQNGKYLLANLFAGTIDFVGFIDRIKGFKGSGRHEMVLSGFGLDRLLQDRILAPASGAEFDNYDDSVETIIKTMVDRHIKTPGSFSTAIPDFNEDDREVPQLMIASDKGLGPTIVYNGRFQKLIDGIRDVMQAAEGALGFTLHLMRDTPSNDITILFDVVPGRDKSRSVVFSPDYDNVSEFEWEHDGLNFASLVVVGGQGTGAEKLLQTVSTAESERFNIERREAYLDASDADTTEKLEDKGLSFLQDKGRVETVRIKKLPGSRPCYKEDFDVGDFVGLRDVQYGIDQASRVEEVTVSCAAGHVTEFDLILEKPSSIGPLAQLSALRQGATAAVARQ